MKPFESTSLKSASIVSCKRRQPPPPPSRVIQLSGADLEPIEDDAETSRDLGRSIELSDSDLQILDGTKQMSPPPRPVRPTVKRTAETLCFKMGPEARVNRWSSREPHGPLTLILIAVAACTLTFVRPTSNSPNVHSASIANTESGAMATRTQTTPSKSILQSRRALVPAAYVQSARSPTKSGPASAHHKRSKTSATASSDAPKSAHGKGVRHAAPPKKERARPASK